MDGAAIRAWGGGDSLRVGAFCSIADRVEFVLGGGHPVDWISTSPLGVLLERPELVPPAMSNGDIVVGNDVWIASGVTILSGVTIGDGAVIGTKSVVTRDIPPYNIAAGSPAKVKRPRFDEQIIEKLLALRWWELDLDDIRAIAPTLQEQPDAALLDEQIARYRG